VLLTVWRPAASVPDPPASSPEEPADEVQWKKLVQKGQNKADPAVLRQELLLFRARFPASPHLREADDWLARLPSAFDALDRAQRSGARRGAARAARGLPAVGGDPRGYYTRPAAVVAVSPDGHWLLGGEEPALRLWDTADFGRPPTRLQPHGQRLLAAAFSPNG